MGEERQTDPWRPGLNPDLPQVVNQTRAANRKIFHEMVRGEIDERPLTWSRRRALLQFAQSLCIDSFEARLIIRAVEFDRGTTNDVKTIEGYNEFEHAYLADTWPHLTRVFHVILIGGLVMLCVTALIMYLH